MDITANDRSTLRRLAERIAEIAALPVQRERRELWRRLNQLDSVRPMVHIYQIPWREIQMVDPGPLALACEDPFCRQIEGELSQLVYQWDRFPGDMVVEPVLRIEPVLIGDDYGIGIQEHTIAQRGGDRIESGIASHAYIPQITTDDDIAKIKIPQVTLDAATTQAREQLLNEVFGDLLEVDVGIRFGRMNIAPWDRLVHWTGVTEILTDLALRPDYVHAIMERLTQAHEARLNSFQELGLLKPNNVGVIIGQGGLGYTDELPGDDYDSGSVRFHNLWGGGMAQVFSEVSPAMHREFALDYEARCLRPFGLLYYGCCEPLHLKVDLVREMLPKVRKISMSPMADPDVGTAAVGETLVYSSKPNPAYLATETWRPDMVEAELRPILDLARDRGCHVELILKDISTVRCEPERLNRWSELVTGLAQEYAR